MTASAPVLKFPDIHERWPFPAARNRWESINTIESLAWVESFSVLSAPRFSQFKAIKLGELASMTYSHFSNVVHHRLACDMLNLVFIFDDLTDVLSAQEAESIATIVIDALRNWTTSRPPDEHPIGEMYRSFSERFHLAAKADVTDRFIANYDEFLSGVIDEAKDRDRKTIQRSFDSYLTMRRETAGAKWCFNLFLISHEIPRDILEDYRVAHIEKLGQDLVGVGNDILSFNVEHARGDPHNAIVVVMQERGLSLQEAMDFVGAWYRETIEKFCTAMRDLPPCGSHTIRNDVRTYVAAIANWVTGNYEWGLRTERYFPTGQDPMEHDWVLPLLKRETELEESILNGDRAG